MKCHTFKYDARTLDVEDMNGSLISHFFISYDIIIFFTFSPAVPQTNKSSVIEQRQQSATQHQPVSCLVL